MKKFARWGRGACRRRSALLGFALTLGVMAFAQDARFTNLNRLTNGQVSFQFVAPAGVEYRIETATNLTSSNALRWDWLSTLSSTGVNQQADAAAASASARLYRAERLSGSNVFTGDRLTTTNGDLVFRPLYHASLVMSWNGLIIYSDPDDDTAFESRYAGLPQGDLILVTHEHGDHYATPKLTSLRKAGGTIVVPQKVYNRSDFAGFRPNAIALHYGQTTNVMGINILAVPGYNGNHTYTNNNCYVLTMGGKRIFLSGDTGDTAEMRALTNIDVAFLAMNTAFTMNWMSATNNIRAMRPKVVYPYHYRDPGNIFTNPPLFKQHLGTDLGIEVRLRNWY